MALSILDIVSISSQAMRFRFPFRSVPWCSRSPRGFAPSSAYPATYRARPASVRRLAFVALQALAGAAIVSACAPAYNWRTVADAAEGYVIDLPAKPTVDERQVAIAGEMLPMHVRAAETEGAGRDF